jgi:hypothetical protein
MPGTTTALAPLLMEGRVYVLRGQKVLLDVDLAALHQVTKKTLVLAVRRHRVRFPEDFMFQLTAEEARSLDLPRSRGGAHSLPYAFNELGIAMLSSVLNTKRAIQLSIIIIRELAQNEEGKLLKVLSEALGPKKKRMGVFTPRAGAVNEY